MAVSVYTGAGGGVASFNGRKGKVVPADGDYTKAQVGLSNVDNTSDANKPISNATQAALNDKQSKITANGILKGDGSGNIIAASETEVELVSLPNICNPNLLDNWYFGNPVNQRGQTSYSGSESNTIYTIDRWKSPASVSVLDGGITVTNFLQPLEASIRNGLRGKTVTASCLLVDGTLASGTAPFSEDVFFVSGDISLLTNSVWNNSFQVFSNTAKNVLAVKLELGSQQTLAHQENGVWVLNEIPKFSDQLAECQRYFLNMIQDAARYTPVGIGVARSATEMQGKISIPVQMRALPVISTDAADWVVVNGGSYLIPTAIAVDGISPALINVTISGPGFSIGAAYELFVKVGGKCTLSADL